MNMKKIILISLSLLFFVIGVVMSIIPSEQFVEIGSIIAVSMIAVPALFAMRKIFGKHGIIAVIALGLFAMIIETIGIYTGFPYSSFEYTMPFGYKLFGTTPWTVFIAWSPLVIGAFLMARTWFKKSWTQFLAYIGILVASDIILDPGAVARGLWSYTNGGLWFDVPLQNFVGWVISGTIAYNILKVILKGKKMKNEKYVWIGSLSLVVSIFLWSGVNAGYELWLPAMMGIILGKILILGLFNSIRNSKIYK